MSIRWLPARRRDRVDPAAVSDALRMVRDGVRGGMSLRQATVRAAAADGSPLCLVGPQLAGGAPVAEVLRDAASKASSADLSAALLVLSVQAHSGGDPVPALRAAEDRIRERAAAEREARAMTTQARMSARAMLMLSPGFLGLLFLLDPQSVRDGLSGAGRYALGTGVVLQALGAAWISRLVRGSTARQDPSSGWPVLRAVSALVNGGGRRSPVPTEVAQVADVCSLVLRSGVAPGRALEIVAPVAPGSVGEALRTAVAEMRAGTPRSAALGRATDQIGDPQAVRLAEAFAAAEVLGVPLAPTLEALGDDLRRDHAAVVSEDVRKASVKVLLPLGLLILPAFVLACLVPLVLGGLDQLQP